MKKRSKEANKRKQAKKERKARARKLRKERATQREVPSRRVDIETPDDWMDYLKQDALRDDPYHHMAIFPTGPEMLGKADELGIFSTFLVSKFYAIWKKMDTGEIIPDHVGIGVLWFEDAAYIRDGGDPVVEATSLFNLNLGELFEIGAFSYDTIEQFALMIEESVRNAHAMHEENRSSSLGAFAVFFEPIDGPFKESHMWKHFADEANLISRKKIVAR